MQCAWLTWAVVDYLNYMMELCLQVSVLMVSTNRECAMCNVQCAMRSGRNDHEYIIQVLGQAGKLP